MTNMNRKLSGAEDRGWSSAASGVLGAAVAWRIVRSRSSLLALIALAFQCILLSQAKPERLDEYAGRVSGTTAYGMYLSNEKVGWRIVHRRIGDFEGNSALIVEKEGYLRVVRAGTPSVLSSREREVYALKGRGDLLLSEETSVSDGATTVIRAVRKRNHMVVTTTAGGHQTIVKLDGSRDVLADEVARAAWAASPLVAGDTFSAWSLQLSPEPKDRLFRTVWTGAETVELDGRPVRVNKFRIEDDRGGHFLAEETVDGSLLRMVYNDILEMRRESEDSARDVPEGTVDLFGVTCLAVGHPLGDAKSVTRLVVRVEGLGSAEIPGRPWQKVERESGDAVRVEVEAMSPDQPFEALPQKERERYLEATAAWPADNPALRQLAESILDQEMDTVSRAQRLVEWVWNNLQQRTDKNAENALDVMISRAGDCTEHAMLFIALARAAGIPARPVGGIAYAGDREQCFVGHEWAEFHNGERWVTVDPTWNEMGVDATHLQLEDEAHDSVSSHFGSLRLTVLDPLPAPEAPPQTAAPEWRKPSYLVTLDGQTYVATEGESVVVAGSDFKTHTLVVEKALGPGLATARLRFHPPEGWAGSEGEMQGVHLVMLQNGESRITITDFGEVPEASMPEFMDQLVQPLTRPSESGGRGGEATPYREFVESGLIGLEAGIDYTTEDGRHFVGKAYGLRVGKIGLALILLTPPEHLEAGERAVSEVLKSVEVR